MCDTIYNRDTNEEIDTQSEFSAFVGSDIFKPRKREGGLCLCSVDIEKYLKTAGYAYEPVNGDTTDIVTYKV